MRFTSSSSTLSYSNRWRRARHIPRQFSFFLSGFTSLKMPRVELCDPFSFIVDILLKESLNSDGKQLYQYQQNKQSPLTEYKKDHNIWR